MLFAVGAGTPGRRRQQLRRLPARGAITPARRRTARSRHRAHLLAEARPRHRVRLAGGARGAVRARRDSRVQVPPRRRGRRASTIRELGDLTGHKDEGNRAARQVQQQIDEVRARVRGRPRPRTMLVMGRDAMALRGVFASGGIGFLHELLDIAGGDDVFADVKREAVQPSNETMLVRAAGHHRNARIGRARRRRAREGARRVAAAPLGSRRQNRPHLPSVRRLPCLPRTAARTGCHRVRARPPSGGIQPMKILGCRGVPGKDSAWALHLLNQQYPGAVGAPADHRQRDDGPGGDARRPALGARGPGARRRPAAADRAYSSPVPERNLRGADADAVADACANGFTHAAFGDLFLEDIRRYREEKLAGTGLSRCFRSGASRRGSWRRR